MSTEIPSASSSGQEDTSSDSDRSENKSNGDFPKAPTSFQSSPIRKTIMINGSGLSRPRGRGASISEQGRMRRKYKRSMSANAGMIQPALTEHNLRTILTKEKVPHMDHYRQSIDHGKIKKTFGK